MLIQPDGKFLLLVRRYGILILVRVLPSGSVDPSFGVDGVASSGLPEGSGTYGPSGGMSLQTDGSILIASFHYNGSNADFALVRLTEAGIVDSTFGTDGIAVTAFDDRSDIAFPVAVQPDGKIVVAGMSKIIGGNEDFALARYYPDGGADSTFGTNGKVLTVITGGHDEVYALGVQSDGKILASGICTSGGNTDAVMVRYLTNGVRDASFGSNGIARNSFGADTQDAALSMVVQPDGKIIATGYASIGNSNTMAILRLLEDGSLDTSFGGDGTLTMEVGGYSTRGHGVCLQPDGKILVVGTTQSNNLPFQDICLVRFGSDGIPDEAFGSSGSVMTAVSTSLDEGHGVVLQSDLKIVVAGFEITVTSGFSGYYDCAMVRYLSGLNIGIAEFSTTSCAPFIFPNPLVDQATLEFELTIPMELSCELVDSQGRTVRVFFHGLSRSAGLQHESLDLSGISAGDYTIILSDGPGKACVRVVKQ
ncbi:MAG: hypothetical protein IPP33_07305 [Flavobacteriales bacterium]|nr:hypothetical protein [Flavobacteriales bacterium]